MAIFRDRVDAGQQLARQLAGYAGRGDVLVLALPRGGVPVGFQIADALGIRLDVFVVRKLGVPWHQELAMGAIASGGVLVLNDDVVAAAGISRADFDRVVATEAAELARREQAFREGQPPPAVRGQTVILVDDGLATGATMRAAVAALQQQAPARIVLAIPVAPPSVLHDFLDEVDEIVCPATPSDFYAIGMWYNQFDQTTDEEVRHLLHQARQRHAERPIGPRQD